MAELPCKTNDPDLWFPIGTSGPAVAQAELAAQLCGPCPIRTACLQRALDLNAEGVWGGATEPERRQMLRRREWRMDSEEARRIVAGALASA
jgi:WhiB family redox-sensing transcriptional regulator